MLSSTSFDSTTKSRQKDVASGYFDDDTQVPNGRLAFPAFAAGALSTPNDVLKFLRALEFAYHNDGPDNLISHDTARLMLHAQDKGCREFMGCLGGMGVFVVEAGENRLMLHQGANEGFRSLYLHCFSGPDRGKGFVICVNQDNKGVFLVAQVAAILINHLKILGIDYQKLNDSLAAGFSTSTSSQEQLVNKGFKELLFASFIPDRAESPIRTDLKEIFSDKSLLQNAKITSVSNDRFAPAENVISPFKPVFDPELFGRQGKIMDSWESARHNSEGVDWIDLKLASPESVRFVRLSTEFHDGNHAPQVSISGRKSCDQDWSLIVDHISLSGHSDLRLKLDKPSPIFSEIRIEMFPDGGLTRVQLFNDFPDSLASTFLPLKSCKSIPMTTSIPKTLKPLAIPYSAEEGTLISNRRNASQIDYASAAFGGRIISASNEHYSPAVQVISPFTPLNMFDGLESARSRVPGHFDEVVIELADTIKIEKLIVDFSYFINNNPKEISVEALVDKKWEVIISKTSVKEYAGSFRSFYFSNPPLAHQIRVKTFPDGGINRIHVFGNQP